MISLELEEAARILGARSTGRGPVGSPPAHFPNVSIDSRTIRRGECFFAIAGERNDGHGYIPEAVKKGAALVVTSCEYPVRTGDETVFLQVEDTTRALQELAGAVRRRWGGPLVAITGSCGKTTTRSFAAELLRNCHSVLETPGNYNNEYGLPLSLCGLTDEDEIAVLELGMNHAGELRRLGRICRPDAALVTNVGPAHLEFFGSLEAIAAAKAEVLEALPERGRFVFNRDDPLVSRMASDFDGETIGFSVDREADLRISNHRPDGSGGMEFEITYQEERASAHVNFPGRHQLSNLAAAAAVAGSYRVSLAQIAQSMAGLELEPRRGGFVDVEAPRGTIRIWDDSYNSSPTALRSVLESFAGLEAPGRKVAVVGDMLELGRTASQWHARAGSWVREAGVDLLITVGTESVHLSRAAGEAGMAGSARRHYEDAAEAARFLSSEVRTGDLVLIKASRGMRLDTLVSHLAGSSGRAEGPAAKPAKG